MSALAQERDRSTFSSAWGTVMATAGVAIGLGNIWRFPYMMGKHGGAVFLLVYLIIIVAFAVPALMAEWALGRHTRRGTWGALTRIGLPGGSWCSYVLLLTVTMAASYYGVVLASVLATAVAFTGRLCSLTPDAETASPGFARQLAFVVVTVSLGCLALRLGVGKGIERVSKAALPIFFGLFFVLIVRVLTLDGAMAGLREFLVPRLENFKTTTPLAAMGQAFFSMGLGGTFMVAYGSYLRDSENIPRSAMLTAGADVTAALMAGLVVVPAAFAFAIPLDSGPALMFEVMPRVFGRMPSGDLFGVLFFGAVYLIAMLSLMAAYEVVVAALGDGLGWPRRRSLMILGVVQILLAIPALRIDWYIEYSDLVWGSIMQPAGGLVSVVALAWCLGQVGLLEQLRRNSHLPVPTWLFHWLKYGVPIGILATLAYGLAGSDTVRAILDMVVT